MAEPARPTNKKGKKGSKASRKAAAEPAAPAPAPAAPKLDEATIGRAIAIGLPIVTVLLAAAVGVMLHLGAAILVLASGVLLGAISLFWGSLRVLSGEAPLSAALAEVEAQREGRSPLEGRRDMLLRALKDLENERAIGKLEDADFTEVSERYRAELRDVLRDLDGEVSPYLDAAERAIRKRLEEAGLVESAYRGRAAVGEEADDAPEAAAPAERADEAPRPDDAPDDAPSSPEAPPEDDDDDDARAARATCDACGTSNEPDASFCKKCGAKMTAETADA